LTRPWNKGWTKLILLTLSALAKKARDDEDEDTPRISRKRQLEQTLNRAESSFNSLFELRSKLEQHETNGLTLDSQISSEIAKSIANRDIGQKIVFSVARTNSLISNNGDSSPFKKHKTT
jgi:hypothetical protein